MGDEAMLWELFEAVWARTGVRPRILAGERPPDEEVDRVLETLVEGLLGFPEVLLESLLLEWRHKARLLQEQGGIAEADAYFVVALGQASFEGAQAGSDARATDPSRGRFARVAGALD